MATVKQYESLQVEQEGSELHKSEVNLSTALFYRFLAWDVVLLILLQGMHQSNIFSPDTVFPTLSPGNYVIYY